MELGDRPRLRVLSDHFALLEDDREPWRVAHPLPEVLLLVVCGTIGACDDFDEIVERGEDNLDFLRRFLPYHHGLPSTRWLRILMNRIDAELFSEIFVSWATALRPEAPALVALDGKTSRGSLDRGGGRAALHLVSAFATRERLVIGQEAVADGGSGQATILSLLERLAGKGRLDGALVTIDAVACNAATARRILDAGADYCLAVEPNQPGLLREIETFLDDAPAERLSIDQAVDKGHGRVEERRVLVSTEVDWLDGDRRFPGEYRFPGLAAIARVETTIFEKGRESRQARHYVSSRPLDAAAFGEAIRAHWQIENALHWVLDVTFKEDAAKTRSPNGPKNMAVVRHFALDLVRAAADDRSMKLRRKKAHRDPGYLARILNA